MSSIVLKGKKGDGTEFTKEVSFDVTKINLENESLASIDLAQVSKCFMLEYLYLNDNLLQSIDLGPLVECEQLKELWLDDNSITSIDLTPLAGLDKLESFHLDDNVNLTAELQLPEVFKMNVNRITWIDTVEPGSYHFKKIGESETQEKQNEMASKDTILKGLEQKITVLGNERKILVQQRNECLKRIKEVKNELARVRRPPLLVGTLIELLADNRAIIKSTTGPEFVVNVQKSIKREELIPGVKVFLNQRTFTIAEVSPLNEQNKNI